MGAALDRGQIEKAYAALGASLRPVFGAVFERRRMAAIERRGALRTRRRTHPRVGVGPAFAPICAHQNRIVGIDISGAMPRRGRALDRHKLKQCRALAVMDASISLCRCIVRRRGAQYVITAVPEPRSDARRFRPRAQPGAKSSWSINLGSEDGFRRVFEQGSRRWREGSAGVRSFPGTAVGLGGPRRFPGDRSAGRCRRWGISR